jgi:multiple sugar transport system permease protein
VWGEAEVRGEGGNRMAVLGEGMKDSAGPQPDAPLRSVGREVGPSRRGGVKRFWTPLWTYTVAGLILLFSLFPIYHMVLVSIKSDAEIAQPSLFPRSPTFQRYVEVIGQKHMLVTHFWRQMLNSTLLSLGTAILTLSVSTTCAYAISRLVFPGRKTIFRASLFTYMVPSSFIVIPFYGLMVKYGLVNSYLSVILAETTFATPYCIWVLSEFFKTVPVEIEEAAIMDGASRLRIFTSIVLPLTAPALVALGMYAFVFAWNEFLYVLVLMNSNQLFTVPIALSWYLNQDSIPWGMMMAESTLFSIPPIIFYYVFQRYMVSGLALGAIK